MSKYLPWSLILCLMSPLLSAGQTSRKFYLCPSLGPSVTAYFNRSTAFPSTAVQNRIAILDAYGAVQLHYNPSKYVGTYAGMDGARMCMKNQVGNVLLKHKAYALGALVAIKLGDVENMWYVAPGIGDDVTFHYKVKEYVNGKKIGKQSSWFPSELYTTHPSVFLHINFGGKADFKGSYYFKNYLKPSSQYVLKNGTQLDGYTQESPTYAVTIAMNPYVASKLIFPRKTGKATKPYS